MTAKEYLSQIKKLSIMIEQKIQELYELRRFDGLSAVRMGEGKGTGQARDAAFTRAVENRLMLENKINAMIDVYTDRKNFIIGQIHGLDNPQHIQILYKRYIEFKSLYKIAGEMNYSYDHIRRVHGYALQAFERKWKAEN